MLCVEVDAHQVGSMITVMNETGRVLKHSQVRSSPDGFLMALGHYCQSMKTVLEASYRWGSMCDWLEELTGEVVLAHPVKVLAIADAGVKTDKIDSETLPSALSRPDSQGLRPLEGDSSDQAGAPPADVLRESAEHG